MLVLLLQIGLLLGLALTLGRLGQRVGIPAVVGELCAGVVLGPSVLAHATPGISGWLFPRDVGQMHIAGRGGAVRCAAAGRITGMSIDLGLLRRRGPPRYG